MKRFWLGYVLGVLVSHIWDRLFYEVRPRQPAWWYEERP